MAAVTRFGFEPKLEGAVAPIRRPTLKAGREIDVRNADAASYRVCIHSSQRSFSPFSSFSRE